MIMVALVRSWQDLAKILASIPMHLGKRAKIRVTGQISSSAFLSRCPFGYYLPIASYGTIFAAKWSSNGGIEAVVSK